MKKIEDSYEGRVVNGRIEWKGGKRPPEGFRFHLDPPRRVRKSAQPPPPMKSAKARPGGRAKSGARKTVWQLMLELSGKARGLPPDFARNHDHYIHGAPKK
jgi:hypothetical protein